MRNYRAQVAGLGDIKPRWAYGGHCVVEGKDYIIPDDAEIDAEIDYLDDYIVGFIEVIPETVGQGTGREINGIEIYQGDILKSFHFTDRKKKKHYLYHTVVWNERRSSWYVCAAGEENEPEDERQGSPILWTYLKFYPEAEIAGTIHDKDQA